MINEEEEKSSRITQMWNVLGTKIHKSQVTYFCQVIILYVMICTSLYNLSSKNIKGEDKTLWVSLLCSSIGYLLPSPTYSNGRKNTYVGPAK